MSAVLTPPAPGSVTPPPKQPAATIDFYRLSVDQYHRMIGAGILGSDDKVELLRGLLVKKMSKLPPHVVAQRALTRILSRMNLPGWVFQAQDPVVLADGEPEPDVALIRGSESDYFGKHPSAADAGLVIEVADTSYRQDRFLKHADYAAAGIPVYWIVDVENKRVEVFTDPDRDAGEYRTARTFVPGDAVPVELDGVAIGTVPAAELFA